MALTTTGKHNGCALPEAQRLYYLEAMGIRAWRPLAGASPPQPPVSPERERAQRDPATGSQPEVDTSPAIPLAAPVDAEAWQQLRANVAACTRCTLHESRTQTVFGTGSTQARLLIIGEAPGQEEDRQGEPFVGRAGQLLNAMLLAIGLDREQVYIANILKCRPPENRDPLPEEVACCSPWLQQQIELLKPGVIFAIGRIAAQSLLDTGAAVGALRGRTHHFAGIPLVVGYHPAYLLRRPVEKRKAWQDLRRVRELLGGR